MSIRKLSIEDNDNDYYIKEYSDDSDLDKEMLNIYLTIFTNNNNFYITNNNHTNYIKVKSSSLKSIILKGQLEPLEHTLFCFYQDLLPLPKHYKKEEKNNKNDNFNHKNKLRGTKRKKNDTKENKENKKETETEKEVISLEISSPKHLIQDKEIEDKNDNHNIYLSTDNYNNENCYDPELELLNKKRKKIDKNLILLFNNKIKITNDTFKCFYLCLLFCGLIYTIYILEIFFDKNKNIICLHNFFCFFMSILLIFTGLYGYYKMNEKKYDDKTCIFLTYSSFFSPVLNFLFSRFSNEENIRKNIIINIFMNSITIIFAGICICILKSLQGKMKKGLLFEKNNIV